MTEAGPHVKPAEPKSNRFELEQRLEALRSRLLLVVVLLLLAVGGTVAAALLTEQRTGSTWFVIGAVVSGLLAGVLVVFADRVADIREDLELLERRARARQ